jgi:hypothetical protein
VQLLDAAELKVRADAWLKAANLPVAACGHWYFTWTAFRVECDPQAVLGTIAAFEMGADDPRDGGSYNDPRARAPGILVRKGSTFTADMPVDPEAVRREEAESDVVTGEILKKPVTLEAALQARAGETIAGTISVAFETDAAGAATRRTTVIKIEIKDANGQPQMETATETLERRRVGDE